MENFNFISKLLDGRVVLGAKEVISDNLYIIPVYKVKISFLNLKTDIKQTNGDGESGSINVTPICLLKVSNGIIDIISFDEVQSRESLGDIIPNMLNNIDVNSILKNL